MKTGCSLLLVDDDPSILEVLDARISAAGYKLHKATSGTAALEILNRTDIDLVVSDVKMPNMSGLELYQEIRNLNPDMPVIFLTAYGTVQEAVLAMHSGAVDYLTKPFDGKVLVKKINDYFSVPKSALPVQRTTGKKGQTDFLWGSSKKMAELKDLVFRVANSNVNTLILGESGVGKECIARAVHENSPRCNGPYIIVDCGSTPPGILESELFGHTKGAFTNAIQDKKGLIEAADGGTLFLDEIGNISSEMQHRLLRFLEDRKIRRVGSLEEKTIDCRVLAATNADLPAQIESGKFRQDLYFRLKVVTLNIPPLRTRLCDIPALAEQFIRNHCEANNLEQVVISNETMRWLQEYSWPGNVREMKNALEAGVILCRDGILHPDDLQIESSMQLPKSPETTQQQQKFSLEHSEKEAIIRALRETNGVQKSAAELLNISRRSIHYKLKKYNIRPSDYK